MEEPRKLTDLELKREVENKKKAFEKFFVYEVNYFGKDMLE